MLRKANEIELHEAARLAERRLGKRRLRRATYRAKLLNRIPAWANLALVAGFYRMARQMTLATGIPHEVDHVVPLLGKTVSGLHVENNLRVIPMLENRRKSNIFIGEWCEILGSNQ